MSQPVRGDAVKLLVGFSEGSASNIVAKMIAPELGAALGRTVEIERVPGENGALCMECVARAAPDGNTLAIAIQANVIGSLLHERKRYDPLKDLAAVALFAKSPLVLAVSPSLNVESVSALTELAKSRPGELIYGASAVGGAPHLGGVLFNALAGTELRLRVYAETNDLYADLAAGRIALTFNNVMSALPLHHAGKLKVLAVTSGERTDRASSIPTLSECGLHGYDITNSVGIVAPAGTPLGLVKRINSAVRQAIAVSTVRESLLASGMEPVSEGPEYFTAYLRDTLERWGEFVRTHRAAFRAEQCG